MKKQNRFNIPNVLSAYRLVALPFIAFSIYDRNSHLYITLLAINLVTDILDGMIARAFDMQTEFGARLDSAGDAGTYLMAFCGMIFLQGDFISEKTVEFVLLVTLYFSSQIVSLLRFGRLPSLHLYSSKIAGYLQGIFIVSLFLWGYDAAYFYFMLFFSSLAYIEELFIVAAFPVLHSNAKGIWFLKNEQGTRR